MHIKILSLPDDGKFIVGNYYKIAFGKAGGNWLYVHDGDDEIVSVDKKHYEIVI